MLAVIAFLIIAFHSGLLWKYRNQVFTKSFRQKLFLIYGVLALSEQIWFVVYQSSLGNWYHLQYTDLCLMAILLTWVSCLFNLPFLQRTIAPWALLGGTLSSFGSDFGWNYSAPIITTSFLHHWILLSFALSVIMTHQFSKQDIRNSMIFLFVYAFYVFFMCSSLVWITGDKQHTFYSTMMFPLTYTAPGSDYSFVGKLGIPYPIPTIFFYCCSAGIVFLIWKLTYLYNQFQKRNYEAKKTYKVIGAKIK